MGDDGELYGPITTSMVKGMKELVKKADLITPNYTEAAFLLNREYKEELGQHEAIQILKELSAAGPGEGGNYQCSP